MKRFVINTFCILLCMSCTMVENQQALEAPFADPPEWTRPWCLWYWLDGKVTEEGITKDLENLAQLGMQRILLYRNIQMDTNTISLSRSDRDELTRYSLSEAGRLGMDVYMFNCPGWSQSGGPWIKPEQSMQRLTWKEFSAEGGAFSEHVRPVHEYLVQDVAVLAVPHIDKVTIRKPCTAGKIEFTHSGPFTARSLSFIPNQDNYHLAAGLFAILPDGEKLPVLTINERVAGRNDYTGFLPLGPETYSFKDTRAKTFVLEVSSSAGVQSIELSSQPKVEQVIEKQLGRMHPTPSPNWESYLFSESVEPDDPSAIVKRKDIVDLTDKLNDEGILTCTLPEGKWSLIYFGMTSTGKKIHPAPPEDTGLECDKMSKSAIEHNFNSMFSSLLASLTPEEKSAFTGITIDSWEVGSQNWTGGFDKEFKIRNGYDPISLLPVLTGRVVESAETSDRFLGDLRRTVAEVIAEFYVGGLRDIANENGMQLWMENYGHWGFPGEFLNYAKYTDHLSGEFWTKMIRGNIECRAASSAGHIYGKSRIYAEAFTSMLDLEDHPYVIKARGDEAFCLGINHFVMHVSIHQPQDGSPGLNPAFGTPFHRNSPWFNESRNYIKYLQRCHFMLQQGEPLADVAVYIGDFAPQMIGPANPVPSGYEFDYINSDVIMNRLSIVDGQWVVYDEAQRIAARWKLLALPTNRTDEIRPQVKNRLDSLIAQGGRVVHSVPVRADDLAENGVSPALSDATCELKWIQRQTSDADIYFVSGFEKRGPFSATFRSKGSSVEVFNPYNGQIMKTAWFRDVPNGTRVTLDVKDPSGSYFVVIRKGKALPSVVSATRDGMEVSVNAISLCYDDKGKLLAETTRNGNYLLTLSNDKALEMQVTNTSRQTLEGPWKINFGRDAATLAEPFTLDVEELQSWDQLPDERAKEFTGTADYETTLTFDQELINDGRRVYLDLGNVNVMAAISVNGKTLETMWMPPFRTDITELLQQGQNALKVRVTSTSPCASPGMTGPVGMIIAARKELKQ